MRLAIIAATGKTGEFVVTEALSRDITPTAIVRNPAKLSQDIPAIQRDILAITKADLAPFDIVICTFGTTSNKQLHVELNEHLVDLLKGTKTRLIEVGSGSNLFTSERHKHTVGDRLIGLGASTKAHAQALQVLRASTDVDWTYVAPPVHYLPTAERTGVYQTGTDVVLKDRRGKSEISYADMAVALLDEAMNPHYQKQMMTVAWK